MLAAPLGILDLHRLPTLVVGDLGRSQRQLALLTAGAHCVLAVIVLRSPPRAETGDGREGSAATGEETHDEAFVCNKVVGGGGSEE
eukprot:767940-Hanusia_phi.AAC.6